MKYKVMVMTVIVLLCSFFVPDSAYAYIDPGAGSSIYQSMLSVFAGFAMLLKKIKFFLKKILRVSKK